MCMHEEWEGRGGGKENKNRSRYTVHVHFSASKFRKALLRVLARRGVSDIPTFHI